MTSYASLETLKAYLGIDEEIEADDDEIERLLAAASAIIDSATGTRFGVKDDSMRHFGGACIEGDTLHLDTWLAEMPTSVTNGHGASVSLEALRPLPRNERPLYALRLLGSSWSASGGDEITVMGKWGWAKDVPDDIVQACVRLAAYMYRQKDNSGDLDRPLVAGNATVLPSRLPDDVTKFIRPYQWLAG